MALWNEIGNRLTYLFRRSRFDGELEEEIQLHIQARADELEQAGLSGADALLQARREFGSTLHTRAETRSAWQMRWLEDLGSDLRYAARALRRNLTMTLAAVGSLALAMALYAAFSQRNYAVFAHFFVRTRGAPAAMVRRVDETLGELDPAAAVETRDMRDIFAGALLPSRVGAAILGSMALFGLMLASIGLYGVLLYAIQQRIHEIGIRVALGATPGNILAMVTGQSLRLVTAGVGGASGRSGELRGGGLRAFAGGGSGDRGAHRPRVAGGPGRCATA